MFSHNDNIQFSKVNVIGQTVLLSESPLQVDISKEIMLLEIPCEGSRQWQADEYLIVELEFEATSRTFLNFDFYMGDTKRVTLNYSIIPNHRIKIAANLRDLKSDAWYLLPHPGSLKAHNYGRQTHISQIDSVRLRTENVRDGGKLTIYHAYLSKNLPNFTVTGEVMVDRFGQYAPKDFPGKIHSEQELLDYLHAEYKNSLASSDYQNPDWNVYGGYRKLRFDKTGHFHTHFDGNRWWLVDPDGCAFLSNGICYGTRMGVHGVVTGVEGLFEWIPEKSDPTFRDAWTTADNIPEFVKRNGAEIGKTRTLFNFARANMIRAFGESWWEKWVDITVSRLKKWGFNTISVCVNNYFDEDVYGFLKRAKIPYTWTLKSFPKTKNMIFRDFPDVFSLEYRQLCEEFAKQLEPLSDDPYMIGYFINNEPEWLVASNVNIAERLLVSPLPLESKKELIRFLQDKYPSVEAFNRAWQFDIHDFEELLQPVAEDRLELPGIKEDLEQFRDVLIDAYNQIPNAAVKHYAPHNLCLGMRYAAVREEDLAGTEYYDAWSFNCYRKDNRKDLELARSHSKTPFMIGEWQYGSSDTCHLCSALVTCSDEIQRGMASSNYIKHAFSNPQLVGAHYFEYNDQPILGRFDGEAMPHGLISVTNLPHEECLKYFIEANQKLYDIALGKDDLPEYDVTFTQSF